MKRGGVILLFLLAGHIFTLTAANNDIIAEIDGVPLKISDLAPESRQLMATNSTSQDVLDISKKAAVSLEVKLRTTLKLLKLSKTPVNIETARKYIEERCSLYPKSGKLLKNGMLAQINDRKFQLKCAIYYFVSASNPELINISREEISNFYHANSHLFRRTAAPDFLVIKVRAENPNAKKNAEDIRLSLLQGQNICTAAAAAGLTPEKADAAAVLLLQEYKIRKNGVSPVFRSGDYWLVALCTEEGEKGFSPLENVESFIAEELLSRRCGAAFDQILKQEISKINIKYRR